MNTKRFSESELILRPDNSVYHLGVKAENVADNVIIVGDPDRVPLISDRFTAVDWKYASREFCIHTGNFKGTEVTVVSSGIGVDNIDILINELDAAVNINPETRMVNPVLRKLNFIRLGTSGALNPDIMLHEIVCSESAIGMDGVPHFYKINWESNETELVDAFIDQVNWPSELARPYAVNASKKLMTQFSGVYDRAGITVTANGFYGPQNRELRGQLKYAELETKYREFSQGERRITNFEMETAGIYALSKMLGHSHVTLCVILANRINREFSSDPSVAVNHLIDRALDALSN